jgi:hypothetical protein
VVDSPGVFALGDCVEGFKSVMKLTFNADAIIQNILRAVTGSPLQSIQVKSPSAMVTPFGSSNGTGECRGGGGGSGGDGDDDAAAAADDDEGDDDGGGGDDDDDDRGCTFGIKIIYGFSAS